MPRRALDIGLLAIFILSVAAIFLAHEDPFAREAVCAHIRFCPHVPKAWHKIIYDLAVGALVSLFFYWLVVRLPDYQRRQRLKRGLEKQYRSFRLDCIKIMMMAADGSYLGREPINLSGGRLARVRCAPITDKIARRSEMTRCARRGHTAQWPRATDIRLQSRPCYSGPRLE